KELVPLLAEGALVLAKRLLRLLTLRHVRGHADKANGSAGRIPFDDLAARIHPDPLPFTVPHPVLGLVKGTPPREHFVPGGNAGRNVLGMNEAREFFLAERDAAAGESQNLVAHSHSLRRQVNFPRALHGDAHSQSEPLLALAESFFSPSPLTNFLPQGLVGLR